MGEVIFAVSWLSVGFLFAIWKWWAAQHLDIKNYYQAGWHYQFPFPCSGAYNFGETATSIKDISLFWGRVWWRALLGIFVVTILRSIAPTSCLFWWFVFGDGILINWLLGDFFENKSKHHK